MLTRTLFALSLVLGVGCKARQDSQQGSGVAAFDREPAPASFDELLARLDADLEAAKPGMASMPVSESSQSFALDNSSQAGVIVQIVEQLTAMKDAELTADRVALQSMVNTLESIQQSAQKGLTPEENQRLTTALVRVRAILALPVVTEQGQKPAEKQPAPVEKPELVCKDSGSANGYGWSAYDKNAQRINRVNGNDDAMTKAQCEIAIANVRDGLMCGSIISLWAFVTDVKTGNPIGDVKTYTIAVRANRDACLNSLKAMRHDVFCVQHYGPAWDWVTLNRYNPVESSAKFASFAECDAGNPR